MRRTREDENSCASGGRRVKIERTGKMRSYTPRTMKTPTDLAHLCTNPSSDLGLTEKHPLAPLRRAHLRVDLLFLCCSQPICLRPPPLASSDP